MHSNFRLITNYANLIGYESNGFLQKEISFAFKKIEAKGILLIKQIKHGLMRDIGLSHFSSNHGFINHRIQGLLGVVRSVRFVLRKTTKRRGGKKNKESPQTG